MTVSALHTVRPPTPVTPSVPKYLALGDSIAFGLDPRLPADDPSAFVGYPNVVAERHGLELVNLAAPGETSGSMLDARGSNGTWVPDPNHPSRLIHARPLHVPYDVPQTQAAVEFLAEHPETELVTFTIGGNDFLLMRHEAKQAADVDAAHKAALPVLGREMYAHVKDTLGQLREVYGGPIVVTTTYDTDYANPLYVAAFAAEAKAITRAVATVDQPGAPARVADVFHAFETAVNDVPSANGSAGAAGLLIPFEHNGRAYDVHPSARGRDLIADVVDQAYRG